VVDDAQQVVGDVTEERAGLFVHDLDVPGPQPTQW